MIYGPPEGAPGASPSQGFPQGRPRVKDQPFGPVHFIFEAFGSHHMAEFEGHIKSQLASRDQLLSLV